MAFEKRNKSKIIQEYDTTVIGRTALLILESVSLVGGLVAIFVLYCMEQIQGNYKDKDL